MNCIENRAKLVNVRRKLSYNRDCLTKLYTRYYTYCETAGKETEYCIVNYCDKKQRILDYITQLEKEKKELLQERKYIINVYEYNDMF